MIVLAAAVVSAWFDIAIATTATLTIPIATWLQTVDQPATINKCDRRSNADIEVSKPQAQK